jgi:membrane protease YdiL (CAAX protease family)
MVGMDLWLQAAGYPQIPQTPLPQGLLLIIIAGLTEEFALRLFLIPFLIWLLSALLLRGRWQAPIFWLATTVSAVLYALLALTALGDRADMAAFSSVTPVYLLGVPSIFLYSLLAAFFFRRAGFLAALSLRFGFYFVWHVLWVLA